MFARAKNRETAVVPVSSMAEERAWLAANPCRCGGVWSMVAQVSADPRRPGHLLDRVDVVCRDCGGGRRVLFEIDEASTDYQDEIWELEVSARYEAAALSHEEWKVRAGRAFAMLICPCGSDLEPADGRDGAGGLSVAHFRCPACDHETSRLLLNA